MQSCLLLRQSASSASKLDPLVSSGDASLAAVREEVNPVPVLASPSWYTPSLSRGKLVYWDVSIAKLLAITLVLWYDSIASLAIVYGNCVYH